MVVRPHRPRERALRRAVRSALTLLARQRLVAVEETGSAHVATIIAPSLLAVGRVELWLGANLHAVLFERDRERGTVMVPVHYDEATDEVLPIYDDGRGADEWLSEVVVALLDEAGAPPYASQHAVVTPGSRPRPPQ